MSTITYDSSLSIGDRSMTKIGDARKAIKEAGIWTEGMNVEQHPRGVRIRVSVRRLAQRRLRLPGL